MQLYSFTHYRAVLDEIIQKSTKIGQKSRIAEAMGCHPSYITKVLTNKADLSLEQGLNLCRFLEFSELETDYFLLLINLERSGTQTLKVYFEEKRREHSKKLLQIVEHMPKNTTEIADKDVAIYYSHWSYAAIHVLVSLPEYATSQAIAEYLGLSVDAVEDALNFLQSTKLIKFEKDAWHHDKRSIHLVKNSPFIKQHHQTWRNKGLQNIDRGHPQDFHYSGVFTIAASDLVEINGKILKLLAEIGNSVMTTTPEKCVTLNIDFFELGYRT